MYFSTSLVASALLALAAATSHEGEIKASETPAAVVAHSTSVVAVNHAAPTGAAAGQVPVHIVQVGGANASLIFSPESITVNPGELVQFQFNPKAHSVVQAAFAQPCIPIQNVMPNKTDAFFSGFMPTNASAIAAGNVLTYTIRVMDTQPIWYYCSQGQHCQAGMVGVINPPASGNRTLAAFKESAKVATENLSPGQAPGGSAQPSAGTPGAENTGAGGATGVAGGSPTASIPNSPAQQSTNAATSRFSQSFFGLALTLLAAFVLL